MIHKNDKLLSDNEIIEKYMQGNEACLSILISRHQQKVFGFIMNKVKNYDVANDIFQDLFIKIIHQLKLGKYNDTGKFSSWALRIAHNMCIDYFRKEKRNPLIKNNHEDFDIFDFVADTSISDIDREEKELMLLQSKNLLSFLPKDQKEVLEMRIFMGYSFKEIAEMTDVSINTALGRMRYALMNIRKLAEEQKVSLFIQ